jgi:small subunit ribosomal protein S17
MAEKNRKVRVGRVVSDKMEKTVVVAVQTMKIHPLYKKRMRRSTKFMAHDEHNTARMGDLVRIEESRPYSKRKTWRLREVLERKQQVAPVAEIAEADVDLLPPKAAEAESAAREAAAPEPTESRAASPAAERKTEAEGEEEATGEETQGA